MYGLLNKSFNQEDYLLGVVDKKILNQDRNWVKYLPTKEIQRLQWGDTYGCVSFSALNCIETLFKFNGEHKNFSDRFTIVTSGTVPRFGNGMRTVAESIRKDGVLLENEYTLSSKTEEEFYQPIPEEIKNKAFKLPISWEYIKYYNEGENRANRILEALAYAPIQAAVNLSVPPVNNIYLKNDKNQNHCVTIFNAKQNEYFEIYDHYEKDIKRLSWDFNFGACIIFSLEGVVDVAKKYAFKLFKNPNSPKVYFSNGEKIAWIENENKFHFATKSKWIGTFNDVIDVVEEIKEDLIF